MTTSTGWRLDNTYSRLPSILHSPAQPATIREPQVVVLNHALAEELGLRLRELPPNDAAALFTGQSLPPEFEPIAQAYAGHQYGGFTMLGDGRAILLGEHRTPAGRLVDIQLKGSGRTQFSRGGDGRAALGPMLREYIISEAMAALGIPTTRSLAVATTGEPVYRATALRGAILTRVAASHIRVGTFEYAARKGEPALRALTDYAIERHDPHLAADEHKYGTFLRAVADRQAALVARWQLVGFVHGVMNTDNVAISGETIDYGPCAFMDAYHPGTVFSSIDHGGRYAYGNQPNITQWNLARFAECLLPLLNEDSNAAIAEAMEVLEAFPARFESHWLAGMRAKLGLQSEQSEDPELIMRLLTWMERSEADFTNTFRDLSEDRLENPLYTDPEFQSWLGAWTERCKREGSPASERSKRMQAVNPAFIPRNHRVEEALTAAEEQNDLSVMSRLLEVLATPFETRAEFAAYHEPAPRGTPYRTFCGT